MAVHDASLSPSLSRVERIANRESFPLTRRKLARGTLAPTTREAGMRPDLSSSQSIEEEAASNATQPTHDLEDLANCPS